MRCKIGLRKVAKYRQETGLPVVTATVRGGTNHRIDLHLEDGTIIAWWRSTGEFIKIDLDRSDPEAFDRL